MLEVQGSTPLSILDFDLENRPLSYLGMDFTTAEITAIAWSWVGEKKIECLLLGIDGKFRDDSGTAYTAAAAFRHFAKVFASADIVTGHYIRGHDLPMLNASMMENKLPPLPSKLAQDTKCDLIHRKGLSMSQENLAALYHLEYGKEHMNQGHWREANRLTAKGLRECRRRVVGDVRQHKALRLKLLPYLRGAKTWNS